LRTAAPHKDYKSKCRVIKPLWHHSEYPGNVNDLELQTFETLTESALKKRLILTGNQKAGSIDQTLLIYRYQQLVIFISQRNHYVIIVRKTAQQFRHLRPNTILDNSETPDIGTGSIG